METTLIIQSVLEKAPRYRLIAYQEGRYFPGVEVSSRESLFAVLASVLPELGTNKLARHSLEMTQIILRGVWVLSEQQLALLGLHPKSYMFP